MSFGAPYPTGALGKKVVLAQVCNASGSDQQTADKRGHQYLFRSELCPQEVCRPLSSIGRY